MTIESQNLIENSPAESTAAIVATTDQALPNEVPQISQEEELPRNIKERLGRQEKKHFKEMQGLQSQISELHSKLMQSSNYNAHSTPSSTPSYSGQATSGSVREEVQAAMRDLIQQQQQQVVRETEERNQQYIRQKNIELESELSEGSLQYGDFDELVRNDVSLPITMDMKQAALYFPKKNSADVFYHLAKNRDEANRISRLHPTDQVREMVALSDKIASTKLPVSKAPPPMPGMKSNPNQATGVQKPIHAGSIKEMRAALMKARTY